jgi:tRNA (adenine57-N1/adenine58-N1)-methyltransferase
VRRLQSFPVTEVLVLLDGKGKKHLVSLGVGMSQVPGLGTFDSGKLRASVGRRIDIAGKRFLVLGASRRDLSETMQRGPQTLGSKDIAAILYETDIEPGARVIEAGSGSGALTVALCRAIGATGRVVSYDVKIDLQTVARANVTAAGLQGRVDFREGDIRKEIPDREIDSFLLDIPDPWAAVPTCWTALKAGGHFASFSPNMEQVKQTVAALKQHPFVDVRTIELIEREMEVREAGVRPSFAPLGHTGYLTFARKVLDTF